MSSDIADIIQFWSITFTSLLGIGWILSIHLLIIPNKCTYTVYVVTYAEDVTLKPV